MLSAIHYNDVNGFDLNEVLNITAATRGWYKHAKRIGLSDDARQTAALVILTHHERACNTPHPKIWMSGFVGVALRKLVTEQQRSTAAVGRDTPTQTYLDPPCQRTHDAMIDTNGDPFILIPAEHRDMVRDVYGSDDTIATIADRYGVRRQSCHRIVNRCVTQASERV